MDLEKAGGDPWGFVLQEIDLLLEKAGDADDILTFTLNELRAKVEAGRSNAGRTNVRRAIEHISGAQGKRPFLVVNEETHADGDKVVVNLSWARGLPWYVIKGLAQEAADSVRRAQAIAEIGVRQNFRPPTEDPDGA